ncbi:unnamed protein product [Prunus armeniaca]|uniref:Ribosomal RNA small subunit methyltransferase E methyltransferase domain-containing protein n=1 Tax=Prunus armeniaca TaxID=36596 RepID=A0A6J5YAX4_PRUAR|nr:unnamed protein product [Prunus armeniaca]
MLLKDLIASCDGKSHPIRCYSAAEIIRATNNFDPSCVIDRLHDMYRGILDDRTVIINKYRHWVDGAIRDIIISMQMSTHKNSLKLLGCCLEFDTPALVFENARKGGPNDDGSLAVDNELLPWKTRLHIAKQLANFTEKEVNELMQAGAISVGLGPHRLRVETATVALLATLMLWLPCLGKVGRDADIESSYYKNLSKLLEDLIASCDGTSHPVHCYSADDLIRATTNFHPSCIVQGISKRSVDYHCQVLQWELAP